VTRDRIAVVALLARIDDAVAAMVVADEDVVRAGDGALTEGAAAAVHVARYEVPGEAHERHDAGIGRKGREEAPIVGSDAGRGDACTGIRSGDPVAHVDVRRDADVLLHDARRGAEETDEATVGREAGEASGGDQAGAAELRTHEIETHALGRARDEVV